MNKWLDLTLRIIIGISVISFIQLVSFIVLYLPFTLPILEPFTKDITFRITLFFTAVGSGFLQTYVALRVGGIKIKW